MVKLRAKKLLALALSILMLTGTVSEWLPTALAVAEPDAVTEEVAPPSGSTENDALEQAEPMALAAGDIPARQLDFQNVENGRPNLYVDFLGDNNGNGPSKTINRGQLLDPANYNMDDRTNSGIGNTWRGYTSQMVTQAGSGQIIFWVGVGVDRAQVWELLQNSGNKGLTSLELGFYYNSNYIKPYEGTNYATTITNANIAANSTANNKWSDSYKILHAVADLPVEEGSILRADPITQDEMKDPSLDNIRKGQYTDNDEEGTTAAWRMTYISLELKDLEGDATRRLAGKYKGYQEDDEGNLIVPDAASGTEDPPEYLMMIPFVLLQHDAHARLCLRLVRDASHFSIGAGNDGAGDGANGSYAAWERVTTRNEGKDLKLQLRFAGDLNIWADGQPRVADVFHKATLLIQNGGGSQNTARLSVQDDKGATPVFVDQNNQVISNLQGGTGMELTLTVQTGYVATVWVYYDGDQMDEEGKPLQMGWPFVTVIDQGYYTFVMPNKDVYVMVSFQPGNTRDFTLYLSEDPKPYTENYVLGNETTVSSYYDLTPVEDTTTGPNLTPVSVNSFDPQESHPNDGHGDGPRMTVSKGQLVTVEVSTHPDYEARVSIFNFNSQSNMGEVTPPDDAQRDQTDVTIIILPAGGVLTFLMPQSDVDVVVEYRPATTRTAKLEVWHVDNATEAQYVKDSNIAQLAYLSYDANAAVSTAYSGQVYEAVDPDETGNDWARDHSAVHDPSYRTAWVPYSAATISNSLGGDTGRTGRIWSAADATGTTSLMATLASAGSESNLATRFNALDLLGADLLGNGTYLGLRKNLDGEVYGDGELADAANLLWELRSKVLADRTPGGLREKYYVQGMMDAATPYYYFGLTPAQVQAYRVACLEIEATFRENQQAYRLAYQSYQVVKQIYDEVVKVEVTADATAPIKPEEPLATTVTVESGLRAYQNTDYVTEYLADYKEYITQYTDYITALLNADSPTIAVFNYNLKARPDLVPVALLDKDAALAAVQAAIDTYEWDTAIVEDATAEVETTSTVSTRSGRTVWLLLEADSAYEVESVELVDAVSGQPLKDPDTGRTMGARASTSFKNVYTFSMPEEDCIIRVNYRLRGTRNLQWQVKGADGKKDNVAFIEAYQVTTITTKDTILATDPAWNNVYPDSRTKPTLARRDNVGHESEDAYPATLAETGYPVQDVLVNSLVTIRLTCNEDYKVTVTATNGAGGNPIQVTANAATGEYTFTVPESASSREVVLTITYAKKSQALHTAYIHLVNYDSTYDASNTGFWDNGSTTITAMSDTPLNGTISLAPEYYIYTSYALGDQGSYPYTLDGNGYNNGMGAGNPSRGGRPPVQLTTTMPDEDLHVYIVVRKGIAPTEPANALTVLVIDDDNTGSSPADNWAKATVYARENVKQQRVEVGAVGKGTTGKGVLRETKYGKMEDGTAILAGDLVEIDIGVAEAQNYYIAQVALAPAHLGEELEWQPTTSGAKKLQFTMPAGSTTVIVRFRRLAAGSELAPSYHIHALKTETDRNGNLLEDFRQTNNKITTADSGTIRTYAPNGYSLRNESNPELVPDATSGRGAGVAGETVTMTFEAQPGWYVQSVAIMTDGSAHLAEFHLTSGNNDGGGGTFAADVVMPTGDAWFIVKYRECPQGPNGEIIPRPEVPEYAITLMVIDNDNTSDPPDDNTVTLSFEGTCGTTHNSITAGGNYNDTAIQYIHAGEKIELTYDLAKGYSLEYMIVNPTALGIVPTYVDPTTAQFTMPARNITVVAKIVKSPPQVYTADLILRPPAGMTLSDLSSVGQGTFVYKDRGSLDNYPQNAVYSLLLTPGEAVDFDLYAFDGYYIKAVKVEPAVGVTPSLTGSFGYQSGGFVMPAANVYVNVYFEKLWPDEVQYDLTLKVNDASAKENNYAYFATAGGVDFPAEHRQKVHGGETYTIPQAAFDGQEITVTLNRENGFYYDPSTITVTDSSGAALSWRMTATGIAFLMPPRSTTVEITFLKDDRTTVQNPARRAILHILDPKGAGTAAMGNEIVRLYRNDGNNAGDAAWTNGGSINNLHGGDVLHLNIVIPMEAQATRRVLTAYAVDAATGEQLMLPITQVPAGGLNSFAVPHLTAAQASGKDIHVYVVLETKAEGDVSRVMNLVVHGEEGSGSATLFETANATTNTVTATAGATGTMPPDSSVGFLSAHQGSALTVTMDPESGYYISQLVVRDNLGNAVPYEWISMLEDDSDDPSVWDPNPKNQITFSMPATGGTVEVTYAKIPTGTDPDDPDNPDPVPRKYTAQVVVNGPAPNDAWLSIAKGEDGKLILEKLVTATPGQWVSLDITVQAGYRIKPIYVSPQSFGIKPQLYLGDLDSQTTGFAMPAGDVVVYVEFVRDDLPVYNATLVVNGYRGGTIDPATDLGTNQATIHSDRSGTRGPIDSSKRAVSVQAVPIREWVTVVYNWDPADSWVSSVTVRDWAGRNVPFTQVDEHTITLPMVARDIIITVTYEDSSVTPPPDPDDPDDPTPALTPVRLHVIDMSEDHSIDTEQEGWGRVIYTADPNDAASGKDQDTGKVTALPITDGQTDADWGNTETIWVPAGRTVTLEAFSGKDDNNGAQIYILSAYVLYRDGGQMIECNLTPNSKDPGAADGTFGFFGDRTATFEPHPDYNDVYVFLTKEVPDANKFSATLMLKSPAGDTGSSAVIWTGTDLENADQRATVRANGDHGRITAQRKETVTVTVTPMEGYAIDYILMTPLGVPITPKRVGNTYTFSMPGYNVSICVYLKRSNEREYTATVHYSEEWAQAGDPAGENNRATISWTQDGTVFDATANKQTPDSQPIIVTENATVTLDVTLDAPYVVLAAYVLQGGSIVTLAPALEGTAETRSMADNSLADGTATFIMPSGNVDVYVVTTAHPPEGTWYTAVLTVKDPDDSGDSTASITRDSSIDFTSNYLPGPSTKTVDSALNPWNHDYLTVREGQKVTVTVKDDFSTGYIFAPPPLLTHSGSYTGTLRPVSATPGVQYIYEFDVSNCDSAVLANFKSKDVQTNPLTVVIEDPDNPGNGTVEQTATVTAGGLTPLTLTSVSSAGAYQIIPNVEEGSLVTLRAEAHKGYKAYAYWSYDGVRERVELTQVGDVYSGVVAMPSSPAQLTVTYYKTYTATITIHDRNQADQSAQAYLEAEYPAQIAFPSGDTLYESVGQVTVNLTGVNTNSIYDLSTDTRLTTTVSLAENSGSVVTAVLATDATGTHFITPDGDGNYLWWIDQSDVEIVVIIDADSTSSNQKGYVASVVTRGKPAEAEDPTLAVVPVPNPDRHGSIWSSANAGNAVTVTVPPVTGYRVSVTARNMSTNGNVAVSLGAGGTYSAIMPAANLEFTVTYEKTPTLTLRIIEPESVKNLTPPNTTHVTGGTTALRLDGQTTGAAADASINVTATPSTDTVTVTDALGSSYTCRVVVAEITMRTSTETRVLYTNTNGSTAAANESFKMPNGDATVIVRYALQLPDDFTPGPDTPDDDRTYYTAWVEVKDDAGQPENRVNTIWNVTRPNTYPESSPDWACGAQGNEMKVSISVKAGYYVTVTAETRDTDGSKKASVPVIQMGSTGLCTASVTMPDEDVFIIVAYHSTEKEPEPEAKTTNVTLVLVGHGGLSGNSAAVTGGSLGTDLSTNGLNGNHMSVDLTSRVYKTSVEAKVGDELRLSANWTTDYKITRATVSLPNAPGAAFPEPPTEPVPDDGTYTATELDLSRYGSNATARLSVPGEGVVVTVYYENIYQATLHVVRNGTTGDETHATDDRGVDTVTSTGYDPIYNTGDKLISLIGGEEIQTTAKPGETQRLVGVVWESLSSGASSAIVNAKKADQYDFTMPQEDVDFYAVYQTKPEREEDTFYIAKVRFTDDSQHQSNTQNAVTITNTSNTSAARGTYWTAAQGDDSIVVNVKVAEGYKAEIIATHEDKRLDHDGSAGHYDFYTNRISFVPNLPLGKDASFTMPAGTDVTLTVRFTKGYDFELKVADASGLASAAAPNKAQVTAAGFRDLTGESTDAAGNVTYTPTIPMWKAVPGGTDITTNVTPAANAPYKVYRASPFTGTAWVGASGTTGTPGAYTYQMPSEDTVETVLFYDQNHPLVAKVEVRGETDINGNSATPIVDKTDPTTTTTGTVWTTTAAGNIIDLTLTVAHGYVAKIRVRRDNDAYYNNPTDESKWEWLNATDYAFTHAGTKTGETGESTERLTGAEEVQIGYEDGYIDQASPFPSRVSGDQHFRFTMKDNVTDGGGKVWSITDVTVIVEFEFAGAMPQPFDPDNMAMNHMDLDRGFIYGENRGDFALIDIPTLYQDRELFSTDNYNKNRPDDPQSEVKFSFYLYNAAGDEYVPLTLGVDVLLEPEDKETLKDPADLYNYYDYMTHLADSDDILDDGNHVNARTYTGSRFKLIPTDPDETTGARTAGAQALYDMLNNAGSLETYTRDGVTGYRTKLYVMAEDAIGQKSSYTQVWIRPYFTVEVGVISYAPNHTTTASLYKLMTQEELDLAAAADAAATGSTPAPVVRNTRDFKHYRWNKDTQPYVVGYTTYDGPILGANKYYQKVRVVSSELLGGYDATYDPGANLLTNVVSGTQATYALTLEKVSDLTYTRVELNLLAGVNTTTGAAPSYYNPATLTYSISDLVYLITGDVDGDGFTKWQDYDLLYTYVWRNIPWNNTQTEAPDPTDPNYGSLLAAWLLSIHNPDSMVYRCDLNGDGVLSVQDVDLVQTVFDYNRSVDDYLWTSIATGDRVLPFGFGGAKGNYTALFSLDEKEDVFPVERDPYWDSPVDPDTDQAVPLDPVYVDDDGTLWDVGTLAEDHRPGTDRKDSGRRKGDAVMETPMGDEAMDRPAYDPGPAVDLPAFDPEPARKGPQSDDDSDPEQALAQLPADFITEE